MIKNKVVTVYKGSGSFNIPEKACEFMAFWQSKLDNIPPEFMDSATIEINPYSYGFGSSSVEIEIYYIRPETDDEMKTRKHEEEPKENAKRQIKMEQFNKLKKELGL